MSFRHEKGAGAAPFGLGGGLHLRVPGIPVSQGSKRHVGGGRMIESSTRLRPWRDSVIWEAREARRLTGWEPPQAVTAELTFYLPRPKSVSDTKRPWPCVKPDLDKLVRAVFDALTQGGAVTDDASIVSLLTAKVYGPPMLDVSLWEAQ